MSHFLVFNNKNNYSINKILNLCKDFEVVIYNVFNTVENTKYNHTFIYPEYHESEADPILKNKDNKNLGEILSQKLELQIFYFEETSIAELFAIYDKEKLIHRGTRYKETNENWREWNMVCILDWLEKDPKKRTSTYNLDDIKSEFKISKELNNEEVHENLLKLRQSLSKDNEEAYKEEMNKIILTASDLINIFPYIDTSNKEDISNSDALFKALKVPIESFNDFDNFISKIKDNKLIAQDIELSHNLTEKRLKKYNY